jgi:hypothetical protein
MPDVSAEQFGKLLSPTITTGVVTYILTVQVPHSHSRDHTPVITLAYMLIVQVKGGD